MVGFTDVFWLSLLDYATFLDENGAITDSLNLSRVVTYQQ
jgi:hypothetical protein